MFNTGNCSVPLVASIDGNGNNGMISDASNEEKTLLKNKLQVLAQKVV